jgi:hypothetical protein
VIGDVVLVHAHETGDVHVLRDDAVVAWRLVTSLPAPATLATVRDQLVAGGLPLDRAGAALTALVDAALVA